tara:strand:- start:90166 stop:90543 length:378 start_codon:yes stop_codon:yes gene_type:complete
MKYNKIIIRVCHFFGLMKDSFHIDDVKMHIPTMYSEKGFNENDPIIVNDIKDQVSRKFREDIKFEKTCRRAHQVWVILGTSGENTESHGEMKRLLYKEGILFYPCESDNIILRRNEEINKVINMK